MSGRLVAPIIMMPSSDSMPSMDVSNWFTTDSVTCDPSYAPRRGAMASSSSNKMMHGAACFAFLKIWRTNFSDSPNHLLKTSGPLTAIKFAPLSVATALARRVFPVPGGPYKRMPRGGFIPILLNASGFDIGHSIVSRNSCLTFSSPPTSDHLTFGISMNTSRSADGSISFSASLKSVFVTIILRSISGDIALSTSISGKYLRRARIAPSRASAEMSAPTNP